MIVRSVDKSAHHKRLGAIQNIKPWCKIKKMKHVVNGKDKQKNFACEIFCWSRWWPLPPGVILSYFCQCSRQVSLDVHECWTNAAGGPSSWSTLHGSQHWWKKPWTAGSTPSGTGLRWGQRMVASIASKQDLEVQSHHVLDQLVSRGGR